MQSLWEGTQQDSSSMPATPAEHLLPERADVVVIGGGATGLSAARTLARRGASVVLCEAQALGGEASKRSAGMLLTGLSMPIREVKARYGHGNTWRLFQASRNAIDYIEQLIGEEQIACHFQRSGHLQLANRPAHMTDLAREASVLRRDCDHAVRLLSRDELIDEIGATFYHGALLDTASASLHPLHYMTGLALAAQRAGAHLYSQTTVERITRLREGFQVGTSRGVITTSGVLVATNGYTGRATPTFRQRLLPSGSYCIATEVLPADLAYTLSPRNRSFLTTSALHSAFRLTPERRLLFGAHTHTLPEQSAALQGQATALHEALLRVFPQLRQVQIDYAWGGRIALTFDTLFHAGQLDGLYYALGYGGRGLALATYLGHRTAEYMLGTPGSDDSLFTLLKLPASPLGFYDGDPWFLPMLSTWQQVRERVDIIR